MRAKNTGIVDGARLLEEAKKAFEKEGEGAFLELLEWAFSQLLIENFAYIYIPYLPQEVEEIFILGSYPAEWQHYYKKIISIKKIQLLVFHRQQLRHFIGTKRNQEMIMNQRYSG